MKGAIRKTKAVRRKPAPQRRTRRRSEPTGPSAGEAILVMTIGGAMVGATLMAPLVIGPLGWWACMASLVMGGMRGKVSAPPLRRD